MAVEKKSAMDTIMLEELTWPLVEKALNEGYRTVIVPVGSIEQHGYHLPLATDAFLGEALSRRLAEKLGKTLVAPVIRPGCSVHHMSFPGTLDVSPDTLIRVVKDVCFSLDVHGFQNTHKARDFFDTLGVQEWRGKDHIADTIQCGPPLITENIGGLLFVEAFNPQLRFTDQ